MADTRRFKEWWAYLDADRDLTLSEFMAVLLMNGREYSRITMELAKQQREATEHLEGMVGSLDEWLAGDDRYRKIADKRAKPTPILPEREAS